MHIRGDMELELRHLRYFVVVAEEGHITRAAERLGMQQPPLSQRIKAIERKVEAQLFRRKARGVELTEAGRAFLVNARATLEQYERTFESTRRAARGEQGRLCVGVTPTGSIHPFVTIVIRAYREAFPQVSVTLEESFRTEFFERLHSERMDVAFVRHAEDPPEEFVIHPLLVEPLVVALPSAHKLVQGSGDIALAMKDLSDETFIIYARQHGPAFYDATMAACFKAGFSPRFGQEAPRITLALSLVAAGLGIAIVPASIRRMRMEGVTYCRIKGNAQPQAVLNLAMRRHDPAPVVRNFVNLVRRTAKTFLGEKEQAA
jgi:DNA-binding transcriptional LysR family regulator